MKPREFYWAWEQEQQHVELMTPEEVHHMFWLFRATRWDGHRVFFIEKLAPHTYRITHALGASAIISWTVVPMVSVPAAPVSEKEVFA